MSDAEQREEAVFEEARQLQGPEREAYLDQACAGDPALRERIEGLLGALERAGDLLSGPAVPRDQVSQATAPSPAAQPGDRLGRYKLLQQIGEGGCGVVYMAEQEEPVRRRVALKILKPGMDTKQVIARFEAERQALALMEHSNIAKVLDAGATEAGRPYFVMELVRGVRITEFCDENQLPMKQRLELFVQVCQAVQHAHQKGIIHRDLKPSNILVTVNDGQPVPKVIDFGIAKATTGQLLTDKTLFTAFEQFIGTPAYMSPEQAVMTNLDIDTRTDIYSLGVLLYELLTGKTPFDSKELLRAGFDEMRRTIREKEPAWPSTRLSTMVEAELTTTAKRRHTDAPKLVHLVRGDLDWIVMKCLEKDRGRRYETANGLARDIERHLNCEPVVARPPSRWYEFQKTVHRHKFGFAAGAALVLVLAVGVLGSAWQAIRATRAEHEQTRLLQRAEEAGAAARQQEQLARNSADEARRQQRLASEQELLARRRYYAAQMNLAKQAWDAGDLPRTLDLLDTQRPKSGEPDLRSFLWYHLWGQCNAHLRQTLLGHNGQVMSLAFSPDGRTLASSGQDGTVRIWEASTGRERAVLQAQAGVHVNAVAYTADGRTLAAGCWDGLIRLWDMTSGQLRATLRGHTARIRSVAISPDGKTLASGGEDLTIKIWALPEGAPRATLTGHQGTVLSLAFLDDWTLAVESAWGAEGGVVRLWDIGMAPPHMNKRIGGSGSSLTLSPDKKLLVTASPYDIRWQDLITGQTLRLVEGQFGVNDIKFLRDGKTLAFCATDRTVRLCSMPTNGATRLTTRLVGAHLEAALCLAVAPDGSTLASGANDGSIRMWDLGGSRYRVEAQPEHQVQFGDATDKEGSSLCFTPDGRTLVGVMNRATTGMDIASGEEQVRLPTAAFKGVLSPDGKLLATGATDGTLTLWGWPSGHQLASVKAHPRVLNLSAVNALVFSPDGRSLVTGSFEENTVKIWDTALKLVRLIPTHGGGITALAFSPKKDRLAVAIRNERVIVIEPSTGKFLSILHVENGFYTASALAFSPDGELLATGGEVGAVKLWQVDSGQLRSTLKGHSAAIRAAAFSPDGATLATAGDDLAVRLWDVAAAQECGTFTGFRSAIQSVTFSPDGTVLAAGSADGLARLWRASRTEAARQKPEALPVDERLGDAFYENALAWRLATSADPNHRDGAKALVLAQKALTASDRSQADVLDTLAAAYAELGQFTNAVHFQQEALAALGTGADPRAYAYRLRLYQTNTPYRDPEPLASMCEMLLANGKFAEAEALARECLALREKEIPNHWGTFYAQVMLAAALLGQSKYDAAERPLLTGYEGLKRHEAQMGNHSAACSNALSQAMLYRIELLKHQGRGTEAQADLQRAAHLSPLEAAARLHAIDLSEHFNEPLPDPRYAGLREADGVVFDIRGVVRSGNRERQGGSPFPSKIEGINVSRKTRRLHFFHAVATQALPITSSPGTNIGSYRMHFTDGRMQELPIVFGQDVMVWEGGPDSEPKDSRLKVAWRDQDKRLFKSVWENPWPETEIKSLDFVSARTDAELFLIAITAD